MNPPTIGHQKLVDKVRTYARTLKGDPFIYLSHTQEAAKDPLEYNDKIKFAKKAFGDIVVRTNATTLINVMKEIEAKGYENVVLVFGSDRLKAFEYIKKQNGKDYNFESIEIKSAGKRDPDATDSKNTDKKKVSSVEGMSASSMRALAAEEIMDDYTEGKKTYIGFRNGLPKLLQRDAEAVMKSVRKGMNLN